jgi:hypothetical protein
LYAVTTFYVGVGFFVTVPAALTGDRLSAFLGFLIIGGALGAAVVINAVLRLGAHMQSMGERLDEIRERLEQIEAVYRSTETSAVAGSPTRLIDLASVGKGDPSVLAAASLDRNAFPRLVTTMEEEPPAEAAEAYADMQADAAAPADSTPQPHNGELPDSPDAADVTFKNLLREWKLGLRNADLAACRAVFSALVDTADPTVVAGINAQLSELADRTERSLRAAFVERYRERDLDGMLVIGEQICELLPDRPVAEEFKRIRPLLVGRCPEAPESAAPPPLRVIR